MIAISRNGAFYKADKSMALPIDEVAALRLTTARRGARELSHESRHRVGLKRLALVLRGSGVGFDPRAHKISSANTQELDSFVKHIV